MRLTELENRIPYRVVSDTLSIHSVSCQPYPGIRLDLPGKYWDKTRPLGGDFLVRVTAHEVNWNAHSFRHVELFADIERRRQSDQKTGASRALELLDAYFHVVNGEDPDSFHHLEQVPNTLAPLTFLRAVQCLALAEHRRYGLLSSRGGGKWLPWRFTHGIAHGHWTANQVAQVEKNGITGLVNIEGDRGMPEELRRLLKL